MLEGEATARAIKLAAFVGVPLYVVHVMSKDALEEVGCIRGAEQGACARTLQILQSHMYSSNQHKRKSCAANPLLPRRVVAACVYVHRLRVLGSVGNELSASRSRRVCRSTRASCGIQTSRLQLRLL